MQALFTREAWHLSRQLGYDVTSTARGRELLNERVADLIRDGFGEWMSNLETTEKIIDKP
mgnify:FL=1